MVSTAAAAWGATVAAASIAPAAAHRSAAGNKATAVVTGADGVNGLDLSRNWFTQRFNDPAVDYQHRRQQHRSHALLLACLMLLTTFSEIREFDSEYFQRPVLAAAAAFRHVGQAVCAATAFFVWRTGASVLERDTCWCQMA